jgi:hypothetical protein
MRNPARIKNTALAGLLQSPLPDSNRRPPPYHGTSQATGRNPRQRFWLVLAASAPIRFAADCRRLQPRGSIKAPSSVAIFGYVGVLSAEVAREMPDLDQIRGPLALQPCYERDHTATASRMAQPGRRSALRVFSVGLRDRGAAARRSTMCPHPAGLSDASFLRSPRRDLSGRVVPSRPPGLRHRARRRESPREERRR